MDDNYDNFIQDDEEVSSLSSDDQYEEHKEQEMEEEDEKIFKILSKDGLQEEMNRMVNDTSSIIGLGTNASRTLLRYFKWNQELLFEKFCEPSSSTSPEFAAVQAVESSQRVGQCGICLDERKRLKPLASCQHVFCDSCWEQYLEAKVMDEGISFICCPQIKCTVHLDDKTVQSLLKNAEAKEVYKHLELNEFVETQRAICWCPGSGCEYAVKVHTSGAPITCKCGTVFCFDCRYPWHEPVNCQLLKMWTKKCSDDSETANWLSTNTKDCPKCRVTIEKDGGCNHMTCKDCRFEFCWMCLGPWGPHGSGWYSCNRFDDEAAKKARDAQDKSRAALARYLHYFHRYNNHNASLKLEHKLYAQVAKKMESMQGKHAFSWVETQFLKKAVDVLSESRRTLMYTYVFAYYLRPSNQTTIFEDNQRDLELATEQLSEFLERDLDTTESDLVDLKQKVQDKYRYVETRRLTLLRHCQEGTENSDWEYNTEVQEYYRRVH